METELREAYACMASFKDRLQREEEATGALREKNRLLELDRRRLQRLLEEERNKYSHALSVAAGHEQRAQNLHHVARLQVYMETRLRKVHEALQVKPHHSKQLLQQVVSELLTLSCKLSQSSA
eukprot:Tamp_16986.p4 GENE.Tamp_16986~~Tamp_16986.p4  ORF type:complete len:123 (-),score=39.10 Tamp_16986:311-679(-)